MLQLTSSPAEGAAALQKTNGESPRSSRGTRSPSDVALRPPPIPFSARVCVCWYAYLPRAHTHIHEPSSRNEGVCTCVIHCIKSISTNRCALFFATHTCAGISLRARGREREGEEKACLCARANLYARVFRSSGTAACPSVYATGAAPRKHERLLA